MTEKEEPKLTVVKDNKKEESEELRKPTPEEIAQFKEDFEKGKTEFENTKWEISEKGSFGSNDVGLFIVDFMKKFAFWTKTGWMGMIKMDEELKKAMSFVDENTGLQLGYQALEFCAYMLSNPGNTGLDSALEFEKIADKYSKIGIVIGNKLEEARNHVKKVQHLQDKWAASVQGVYLEDLIAKEKEKEELKAAAEGKIVEMKMDKKEE